MVPGQFPNGGPAPECAPLIDKRRCASVKRCEDTRALEINSRSSNRWHSGGMSSALITGISFATSTAIPGSTDNGKPILGGQPAFDVFATASPIGLGFYITALVMFLAIVSSPKHVQHFRLSLPLKLIFVLDSLFASVTSEEAGDGREGWGRRRNIRRKVWWEGG
ncbi:hypothetical protein V8G54_019037 [Vigna mungo]|uniref:PGG domain-containing protein n=1 Tax=Vigna mungo TaxID=3915 RepID=A0AAQ3NBA0_VIGMU